MAAHGDVAGAADERGPPEDAGFADFEVTANEVMAGGCSVEAVGGGAVTGEAAEIEVGDDELFELGAAFFATGEI